MLPKNRLRAKRLERLYVYPGAEHPHVENLMKDHTAEFGVTFKRSKQAAAVSSVPPADGGVIIEEEAKL